MKSVKHSDTLFILGSGPSIRELSDSQWDEISDSDSLGFNNWWAHDFVPSHYFISGSESQEIDTWMATLFDQRQQDLTASNLYVRGRLFDYGTFYATCLGQALISSGLNFQEVPEMTFSSKCAFKPEALTKRLHEVGFLEHSSSLPMPKAGGSVFPLLCFALRQRYRRIVLCGIDMNDNHYFFTEDGHPHRRRSPIPSALTPGQTSELHPQLDPTQNRFTTRERILSLASLARNVHGIQVMVSSETSALHPELPVWRDGA